MVIAFFEIACLTEFIIMLEFLTHFFGWKEEIQVKRIVFILLLIIFLGIRQLDGKFSYSYQIEIVCDILILILFCRTCLKGNIQLQILGCMLPFLILSGSNVLFMQILAFFYQIPVKNYLEYNELYLYVVCILSNVILGFCLYYIHKITGKRIWYFSGKYHFVINAVIVTIIIDFLLLYITNHVCYHGAVSIILLIISALIFLTMVYVGYFAYMVNEANCSLSYTSNLQVQNQENECWIKEIRKSDLRERQLLHDYRNHCLSMQELLRAERYGEVKRYLEEMTGKYMWEERAYVHTQNKVIDSVLNAKIALCKEKDITIHCTVIGDLKLVSGLDFNPILFNLMDNAIEASMRLPEPSKRCIEVNICKEKSAVEIFVKNAITQSVLGSNSELISDKKGERHGIGHQSVELSVEELNGIIEYYEMNQMFCVHIFVPCCE